MNSSSGQTSAGTASADKERLVSTINSARTAGLVAPAGDHAGDHTGDQDARPAVVLVHGGFVDGSGWQGVYGPPRQAGYTVSVVQNPTLSLEGDVAAARRVLDAQRAAVVLVGHSYGGAVVSAGGGPPQGRDLVCAGASPAGKPPQAPALVYVAPSPPDAGDSVNTRIANPPPGAPVPPILPPQD